jgi:hypothetical protein
MQYSYYSTKSEAVENKNGWDEKSSHPPYRKAGLSACMFFPCLTECHTKQYGNCHIRQRIPDKNVHLHEQSIQDKTSQPYSEIFDIE